jgi:signal transduction histidine kinase
MLKGISLLEKNARFEAGTEAALSVAHDIRSPLTTLSTTVPLLSGDVHAQEMAMEAIRQVRHVANSLLDRFRVEGTNIIEQCDVSAIIEKIVHLKRFEKINSDIQIWRPNSGEKIFVRGDGSKIERIITNIINNALEASDPGDIARIKITISTRESSVEVQIQDAGRGIHKNILALLGEARSISDKGTGHGIGIYNSKRMLADMGGDLDILSKVGEGTVVIIRLIKMA